MKLLGLECDILKIMLRLWCPLYMYLVYASTQELAYRFDIVTLLIASLSFYSFSNGKWKKMFPQCSYRS